MALGSVLSGWPISNHQILQLCCWPAACGRALTGPGPCAGCWAMTQSKKSCLLAWGQNLSLGQAALSVVRGWGRGRLCEAGRSATLAVVSNTPSLSRTGKLEDQGFLAARNWLCKRHGGLPSREGAVWRGLDLKDFLRNVMQRVGRVEGGRDSNTLCSGLKLGFSSKFCASVLTNLFPEDLLF